MIQISSPDNQLIKNLNKLYSSKDYRLENNKFVVEGLRLVKDTFEKGYKLDYLFVTPSCIDKVKDIKADNYIEITESLSKKIADTKTPQGVFAVVSGSLTLSKLPQIDKNGAIFLCSLQDPGNVGTILRTASAFNVPVIMSSDCPSLTSPKVLRAAMGCRKAFVTDDIKGTIKELKDKGIPVYASCLNNDSKLINNVNLHNSVVLIGNEGNGLSEDIINLATDSVIIPIDKNCESLNASAAATVFLWELSHG